MASLWLEERLITLSSYLTSMAWNRLVIADKDFCTMFWKERRKVHILIMVQMMAQSVSLVRRGSNVLWHFLEDRLSACAAGCVLTWLRGWLLSQQDVASSSFSWMLSQKSFCFLHFDRCDVWLVDRVIFLFYRILISYFLLLPELFNQGLLYWS